MSCNIVPGTVTASIDCQALRHNLYCVKQRVPHCKIISVIKANAYGHGIVQAANALEQSDAFAVARIDEALKLRTHGISKPIILLEGVLFPQQAEAHFGLCVDYGFIPALNTIEQLESLHAFAGRYPDKVLHLQYWLKVDTGMHRLGFKLEQINSVLAKLRSIKRLAGISVVMSHFACADEKNNPLNQQQLSDFNKLIQYPEFSGPKKVWQIRLPSSLCQKRPMIG